MMLPTARCTFGPWPAVSQHTFQGRTRGAAYPGAHGARPVARLGGGLPLEAIPDPLRGASAGTPRLVPYENSWRAFTMARLAQHRGRWQRRIATHFGLE